ncbi:hypothetical protein [Azonexus sp.]|uniref:hypothetical protein n=1 Tax=Azonexus sp. TaxID=1872668 RepID=UPI0039E667C3
MKIETSALELTASHEISQSRSLSAQSQVSFRQMLGEMAEENSSTDLHERVRKLLESLIERIIAALEGRSVEVKNPLFDSAAPESGARLDQSEKSPRQQEIHWQTRVCESFSEYERTSVCGTGWVKTRDGREISLEYALTMERNFSSQRHSETQGSVVLKDPLMLSFDGSACELNSQRMAFDLAADGSAQWIPQAGGNSCFLVWDRNGNGRADDGRELFGALSGNGFADLAALDEDKNGWIDESDSAFNTLGLWFADRYQSLNAAGIGALYTGAVAAPFALKDENNALLGQIRDVGLYLFEDGRSGWLQQVDLALTRSNMPGENEPGEREQLAGQEQKKSAAVSLGAG